MNEDIAKGRVVGMPFDKIWALGACEGAFSYITSDKGTYLEGTVIQSKQGNDMFFLGIIMQTEDAEEVNIMNCPCVMNNFRDFGVWYGNSSYGKTYFCENRDCSSVCCHECKDSDPKAEDYWKCPLYCYKTPSKKVISEEKSEDDSPNDGKRTKRKATEISEKKEKKKSDAKKEDPSCSKCRETDRSFMKRNPNSMGIKWRFHAQTKERYSRLFFLN